MLFHQYATSFLGLFCICGFMSVQFLVLCVFISACIVCEGITSVWSSVHVRFYICVAYAAAATCQFPVRY